jgi:acetyl-CoA acyltransferase 2
MRPDTTLEALAGLRPYFRKDGLRHRGERERIGDGAASAVLAGATGPRAGARAAGTTGIVGLRGVEPLVMGIGPAPRRAGARAAGLTLEDMDLVEVNEAFAPQYKAVEKELGSIRRRRT